MQGPIRPDRLGGPHVVRQYKWHERIDWNAVMASKAMSTLRRLALFVMVLGSLAAILNKDGFALMVIGFGLLVIWAMKEQR